MNVGDRVFECVRASDDRDGLSLELWEVIGEDRDGPLAEVFHTDATGAMTFTAYASDMPVEAVAWLLKRAHELLPLLPSAESGTRAHKDGPAS